MKKNIYKFFTAGMLLLATLQFSETKAQYCVSGDCNSNTYANSVDPNTIEYDNMVSVFHSSMAREYDGKVLVWGQGVAYNGNGANGNVTAIQELNSNNFPGLTGTVLKFAGGSNVNQQQFAVLTTTGLFVWGGATGTLVSTGVKNNVTFGAVTPGTVGGPSTKADGLPNGVTPADVKMMFGTHNGLAIVTCSGQAWVLAQIGSAYGDGATDSNTNDALWHRVSTAANTPLANVVAVRGTYQAFMALTADGNIYTWGQGTRINSGGANNRNFATLITKPAGVTPKMIGMTTSTSGKSYYLLATNGNLYSLGENESRQLGNGTTTDRNSWVEISASQTILGTTYTMGKVVWISPQEHHGGNYAAINVIDENGKLWAWGNNSYGMLNGDDNVASLNPTYMPGRTTEPYDATKLNLSDQIIAVEQGGHTTLTIKQCTTKFGYVGHKIRGSMANTSEGVESEYNFSDTAVLSICGAVSAPAVEDLKICEGTFADLANAEPASLPSGATGINWWTDAAGTIQVSNPAVVGPGTYYATYEGLVVKCPTAMTISYLEPGDEGYENCAEICTEPVNGNGFGWSYNTSTTFNGVTYNDGSASNGSQVERNFTQPASDYGFELNIYKLDNSFNMKVNNQPLTNQEIQFQANHTQNIRFKSDGGLWGSNGIPNIWQLTGDDEKPIIRVKISPSGAITFWGKRSNDPAAEVEELELIGSHQVNTNFTWNSTGSNNIVVGQKVDNNTQMIGSGFGLKKVPCICYNPASTPGTGPDTKVGITLLKRAGADAPGVWPMARKSGHIALESNTKGFVVTRMTTSQIMTGITTPQEGMMVYDTEEKCLKLYDGTAWSCFNTPTCP